MHLLDPNMMIGSVTKYVSLPWGLQMRASGLSSLADTDGPRSRILGGLRSLFVYSR